MRQRSNSLKLPSKAMTNPTINSKESFGNYEEEDESSNSSGPVTSNASLLTPKPRRFPFPFRKMDKTESRSSLKKLKSPIEKKKKLVLDLDETLIHTIEVDPDDVQTNSKSHNKNPSIYTKIQWNVKFDQKIKDKLPKEQLAKQIKSKGKNKDCFPVDYKIIHLLFDEQEFYVCERPNVREFLRNVCDLFEVYIYTAGEIRYAKPIIDDLCPMIDESHRKYGDQCKIKYNRLYKDLYSFDCPLTDIFIVDDNPENFFFWPKNTILAKPFLFNNDDNNLNDNDANDDDNDDDSESESDSDSRTDSSSSVDLNNFVENYEELENQLNQNNFDIASFIDQNYLMDKLLPILIKCSSAKDVRKVINSWKAKRMSKKFDNDKNNEGIYYIGSPKPLHK